ncbi:MAG TPA: hypothetical protein VGQ10_14825 [Vicinamibacterales bacterium]|jgi:hypothetical protein|nr:hypothetical protein [Vicinamibacterales bacterium]
MTRAISLAVACAIAGGASTFAAQKSDQQMTYTGCVAPGKMAGTFMLTNVMAGDGMKKPDAATAKMTPKELTLSGTAVKIDPHRGHKVTVMGPTMMEKQQKMTETKMTVTSLKMVSTTCP